MVPSVLTVTEERVDPRGRDRTTANHSTRRHRAPQDVRSGEFPNRQQTVHTRMPVLLQPAEGRRWLADAVPLSTLLSFLRPYPAELIKAYQVSTLVNRASVDQPELIKPECQWERS